MAEFRKAFYGSGNWIIMPPPWFSGTLVGYRQEYSTSCPYASIIVFNYYGMKLKQVHVHHCDLINCEDLLIINIRTLLTNKHNLVSLLHSWKPIPVNFQNLGESKNKGITIEPEGLYKEN